MTNLEYYKIDNLNFYSSQIEGLGMDRFEIYYEAKHSSPFLLDWRWCLSEKLVEAQIKWLLEEKDFPYTQICTDLVLTSKGLYCMKHKRGRDGIV